MLPELGLIPIHLQNDLVTVQFFATLFALIPNGVTQQKTLTQGIFIIRQQQACLLQHI